MFKVLTILLFCLVLQRYLIIKTLDLFGGIEFETDRKKIIKK